MRGLSPLCALAVLLSAGGCRCKLFSEAKPSPDTSTGGREGMAAVCQAKSDVAGLVDGAKRGCVPCVAEYLDQGVGIECLDRRGLTALMEAALRGQDEMIDYLVQRGADVAARGWRDYDAAHWAVYGGYFSALKKLKSLGANLERTYRGRESLLHVYLSGPAIVDPEMLQWLLAEGQDPNRVAIDKVTPLMCAALDSLEGVRVLLEHGVKVDVQDKHGITALLIAAKYGDTEIVKLLVNAGASVNLRSAKNRTALIEAADTPNDNGELIRFLLDKGADARVRDSRKRTAHGYAVRWQKFWKDREVVKLLKEAARRGPQKP